MSQSGTQHTRTSDDGEEMRCRYCGYKWTYTGELWNATCPRCNRKNVTPLHPDEQAKEERDDE